MSDPGLIFYTSAEVADFLRLNVQVVQRKLAAGEIPGYRIGREWRVERRQLQSWLDQHSNQRQDPTERWFDRDGKLRSLPAKRSLRRAVLLRLAAVFARDRVYTERHVSALLRRFHDDVASLRREMVAEHIFTRTPAGIYKLRAASEPALRRA